MSASGPKGNQDAKKPESPVQTEGPARPEETPRRPRILLGVTGSVAAKLTPKMVGALEKLGEVAVIATEASLYFWKIYAVGATKVWTDNQEWPGRGYVKGQEIPHIQLGDWADILVIAPLTANTLNKIANGLADNLLTCTYYAFPRDKPIVVAPAMNTRMWDNPRTQEALKIIRSHRYIFKVEPKKGKLACGTEGVGAMADIDEIVRLVYGNDVAFRGEWNYR